MDDDSANPLEWPALDITGDGAFTLSDLSAWALHLFLLPGDAAIAALVEYLPGFARFLELGADDYGGTVSIAISVLTWLVVVILFGLVVNTIRNLDRALTSWLLGRIDELKRRFRIARRRLVSWIGLLRSRAREPEVAVGEVDLARIDAAVLRCYADSGESRSVAADEVAARLRLSLRQVQQALRRLGEYRLLEATGSRRGGPDTGPGHHITRAGQIWLIEH